jgi:hypothetical protein
MEAEVGKAAGDTHGEHLKENVNSADDQHILDAAQEGRTFGGPAGPEEKGDASDEDDESSESDDRSTDSEHDDNSGRLSIPASAPSASPPGVPKLSMTHLRDASAQASSSSSSTAATNNQPKAAPPSVGIHRQMHDPVCCFH